MPNKSDVDFIYSTTKYPDFNHGMQWDAPKSKVELFHSLENNLRKWTEGEGYNFTIESRNPEATRFGRIEIRKTEEKGLWEVGFWTHPKYQGLGIMTEAIARILEFGFMALGAEEIRARYATWNKGSEKVLFNNGFKYCKHIEKGFRKKDSWVSENEVRIARRYDQKNDVSADYCEFCAKIERNKNTIYEDETIVVLLDIDPISLGHVLICPKEHIQDFHDLPDEVVDKMMKLCKKYVLLLRRIFDVKGYSLMLNAGAFNDLKHCHLHVFPRNSSTDFQWIFPERNLSKDATRFEVLKKLFEGYI